jgi:hypothetical protein
MGSASSSRTGKGPAARKPAAPKRALAATVKHRPVKETAKPPADSRIRDGVRATSSGTKDGIAAVKPTVEVSTPAADRSPPALPVPIASFTF